VNDDGRYRGLCPHEHRPLAAYTGLTAAFAAALAGSLAALRASGRELPERPSAADIALAGVATHKLTRLLAKDRVTSFLRAPFARYQEPAGHGELEEAAHGTGLRLAVGEPLGNVPQAISHVGLVNAAQALTEARAVVTRRPAAAAALRRPARS
jgi:hypothetical protein